MGKLEEIKTTALKQIHTDGGDVYHAMKNTDMGFDGFGEAYFSWLVPKAVKAWKMHTRMTMNLIVPVGIAKFVFHDPDANSFREESIGVANYARLTVPPGIWFGFSGTSMQHTLILNIANLAHDANEVLRKDKQYFPYPW